MKFAFLALFTALVSSASAVVVPGADTPTFYLVSSSSDSASNLLPLRTEGGANGYSTLSGSGPIGQFYFKQGRLTAAPLPGETTTLRPVIGFITSLDCAKFGPFGFAEGSSSDKCAQFNSFWIQSDEENSQLGAKLTFNFVGDFYTCGDAQDVWYLASPNNGPEGLTCQRIDLYTVPVAAPSSSVSSE